MECVVIANRSMTLKIRAHKKARRMILRLDDRDGMETLRVTTPTGVARQAVLDWVNTQSDWIRTRLEKRPRRVAFEPGQIIPFRGQDHTIRHKAGGRGPVLHANHELTVTGGQEYLSRRLTDWLKKQARQVLTDRVQEKTAILGKAYGRVSVRDTRTRWGSCSSTGNLSFCWRLVLAPDYVLDYVVAHEVAHLQEHNHSSVFWALTEQLTDHVHAGKRWLSEHGESLHRIG